MEKAEDGHANVLGGIGNDADNSFQSFAIQQFHGQADFGGAPGVHGFEAAKIHQQTKTRRKLAGQRIDFLAIFCKVLGPDASDVTQEQQLLRFVRRRDEHGESFWISV